MALGIVSALPLLAAAQNKADPASATPPTLTADYPRDQVGVTVAAAVSSSAAPEKR
jgi:hypothetical protein